MKKFLLLFSFLFIFWQWASPTFAAQVVGGEITYENIGGDTFLVNLTLYSDCSGIPVGSGNQIIRVSSSCTTPQNLSVVLQNPGGSEVSQLCPAQQINSTCNGGVQPGLNAYYYQGQIVLGTNCSDYLFQYRSTARDVTVNVSNSSSGVFYTQATLNSLLYPNNSSPEFAGSPVPYVCASQPLKYNFSVVENQGDSISYALIGSRSANASWALTNLTYAVGYSATAPFSGISIDFETGELSFTPSTPLGKYIVVVEITEYNGAGQIVGTVIRDLEFEVVNCSNQIPVNPTAVTNLSNTVGSALVTGTYEITANVGDQFCFDVVFSDTNSGDSVHVASNAASVLPGSTVSFSGNNPLTATVCWTVPPGMNTNNTLTFLSTDSNCALSGVNALTVQIVVPQPPGLSGTLTTTGATCNGFCDGTAAIVPSGGVGPYSYFWFPNTTGTWCCQGQDSISNMCTGTYILIVTDLGDPDPSTNTWDTIFSIIDAPPIAMLPPVLVHDNCDTNSCGGAINVFAFGGNGPLSYSWSTGGSTNAISGLCAGNYSLTVTDVNGCTNSDNYTIYEPTGFTVAIDSIDTVSCFGGNDGAIFTSVTPNCGISTSPCAPTSIQIGAGNSTNTGSSFPAPYGNSFWGARQQFLYTAAELQAANIQPGAIASIAFDVATLGAALQYSDFTIKMGCTSSSDLTGGWETGLLEVFVPQTHSVTLGWNTHDFNVDYNWDGVSNIVVEICFNNDNLVPNGNSFTRFTPTAVPQSRYFVENSDTVCSSNSVTGTSLNRPNIRFGNCVSSFSYSWSPAPAFGQTTSFATNLTAQTYTLTVNSNNGCVDSVNVVVPTVPEIISTVTLTNPVSCVGICDAAILVTSIGGVGGFSYSWSGGLPPDSVQTGLCAGTYFFTVTDANGCTKADSITISNPPLVGASFFIIDPISCNGQCDGTVLAIPNGGNGAPYTVAWPAGTITSGDTAFSLCAGLYTLTISDTGGCTNTVDFTLAEPAALATSIVLNQGVICGGDCNAQVTASISGGTPVYSVLWSTGATTASISNLCAGNYSVTVTDANGCKDSASITITEPPLLVLSVAQSGTILCSGDSTVTLTASASGGVAPYSFVWSNGSTNSVQNNVGAGTYFVTLTDSLGCQKIDSVTVTEPPLLTAFATINTPVICGSSCTGSVTITAAGGTPVYTYSWPGGLTGATQNGLCAGSYDITVTDANGCTEIVSFVLADPNPLVLSSTVVSAITCFGECDGEVTVSTTGGVNPIVFTWPGGIVGATQDSLCAGTYVVTATDSVGCTETISVVVAQPALFTVSLTQVGIVLCNGDSGVNINSTITGGTPPYLYFWTGGGPTTPNLTNVGAGTYSLVVADSNLCTSSASITVTEPDTLDVTITINTLISCGGSPTGDITAVGTGGTLPYSFSWSNGGGTANITNLPGGTYTVTLTDANGCQDTASVTLINPSTMVSTSTILSNVTCNGNCDGSATVSVVGGTAPYSITWPAGVTTVNDTATNLCGGTSYIVTITDSILCQIFDTITITQPGVLVASIQLDNPVSCGGTCDANITATASGGTGPYTFQWSNGLSGASINGLCADTYSVTVTDTNMCMDSATIIITEPVPVNTSISQSGTNLCSYDTAVTLTAATIGGTGPYSYVWSNGDTLSVTTNLGGGTYTVTATDANGCSDIDTVNVLSPLPISFDSFNIVNPNCNDSNGSVQVFVSGGTPGYQIIWNGSITGNPLDSIPSGVYTLVVIDTNGCTNSTSVGVSDIGSPVVNIATTNVNCAGECIGTATANVVGTGPFGYVWSNGDSLSMADSLCVGSITVIVTDSSNGCVSIDSATVIQDTSLSIAMSFLDNTFCNDTCSGQASVQVLGTVSTISYLWNTGDTTSMIDSLCAGTYIVSVADTNGCSAVDSVVIADGTPLSVVIDTVINATCPDASNGAIQISVLGGDTTVSFSWTGPNGFSDTTQNISNLPVGQYIVVVTDSLGCMATDTAEVLAGNLLSVTLKDTTLCDGLDFITLIPDVQGVNGTETYLWNNVAGDSLGNGSTLTVPFPSDTTEYWVTVFQDGCSASDSGIVNPLPSPDAEAGQNQTIIAEQEVILGGNPTTTWGGSTFTWTPDYMLSDPTVANPTATPLVTTLYTVLVTNVYGCIGGDTVRISVLEKIEVYSGFSPNGDGENDVWNLPMLAKFPNVTVDIYNRWGELLFHSDGYNEPWDGKFNGEDLPVGTYYYVIDLKDSFYPEPLSGPVTIMR